MPAKYQVIAEEIKDAIEAGKYITSVNLPTELTLTQEYDVSRQTIRRSLTLLTEWGLISRRQGSGSQILRHAPAKMQSLSVAVITTYISDYIFPSVLREVETVLSANHCVPSLFATQNEVSNERRVLRNLLDTPVDGILVEGTKTALPNPNKDLYRQLINKGIPLVFFHGNYSNLPEALSVLDDNAGGGRMLVDYLKEKGHRNIAGIFKSDDIQGHQRYAGFSNAMLDAELPLTDRYIFWYSTELKDLVLSGGYDAQFDQMLKECTALVCYNDEIASYMIGYLRKRGVKVPSEMAVVSFDNSWYSEHSPIRITSLSHGDNNVGRMAAQNLIRLLHGETCHSEKAPWILVQKESG